MKVGYKAWCLSLVVLFLTSTAALAQTASVTGSVRSEGAPLRGAVVQALDASGARVGNTLTNQSGMFRLDRLAPGGYTIIADMTGFETGRANVTLRADQTESVTIEMVARAFELNPVVVSASRRQERALDAPARVEVVGEREIAVRPTVTPIEHLRNVPGVDIASTGVQSSNVVVRGFNNVFSGSLHALTDHRIAGVPSLRVNLLHFVPSTNDDFERMEVVLGPGAALYGPNTANGVLHMMTKSPLDDQGTAVSVATGERSLFHTTVRTAHLLNENFGFKLSGQYLRADEWEFTDEAERIERERFSGPLGAMHRLDMMRAVGISGEEADARIARIGVRDFDIERFGGEFRADWRMNPNATTVFSAGLNNSASGIELTGLGAGQVNDWRSTYYQVRTNWNRFFAQAYLNASDAGDTYLLRNGAPIVDRSRLFVGQVQHGWEMSPRQNFTYGADYLYTVPVTEGSINGIYEDDDETSELGAYLQSETQLSSRFDLILAGRVDTHSALPDAIFSPRAALVFKPSQEQAWRVSYNRAFSTPSSLNQFLDLGSSIPNAQLAQLGYSIRVQGTGRNGFTFRAPDGSYQMRSPFTPEPLGGPRTLLPAEASIMWAAAVNVVAAQQAAAGTPLPPQLVQAMLGMTPTAADISSMYLDITAAQPTPRPLSELNLQDLDPIRESTSDTYELGYKGILGSRILVAADVWYSRRNNLVTPLTIQTPLVTMNGAEVGAYLAPRLVPSLMQMGMTQEQAMETVVALSTGMASVPVGVISNASINANGAQILTTYMNVDEGIDVWGTDVSASAVLTDSWQLGLSASWVNENVFTTRSGMDVMLNAPTRKGTASLAYRNVDSPFNGELRARYSDGYPVNSGVYIGTRCLEPTSTNPLIEPCIESYTLLDASVGYSIPRMRGTTLQLAVQNLFDERYRSFPGSPEIGRMAIVRLRHEF